MYYIYYLQDVSNKKIYIGYTKDLRRRFSEHYHKNSFWKLVYYEAYLSETDARHREYNLKSYGSSLGHLKHRIKNSLNKI